MGFPGLGQEVTEICQEVGIPDASRQEVTKEELKEAIKLKHLAELKAEMAGKKKQEALNVKLMSERNKIMFSGV